MIKVFEALEEIGNIDLGDNPYKKFDRNKLKNVYGVEFATLYNAINELKQIKEANPSEALENLEKCIGLLIYDNAYDEEYNAIEHYILKAQEQEKENAEYKKVLSIIKEKGYDDYLLEEFDTFEAYKKNMDNFYADQLVIDWNDKKQLVELRIYTEEEFDLLNRYFGKNIQNH